MYGNKANNLKILEKKGFNIPKFICFGEDNLLNFSEIENKLKPPFIIRSSYSIEDGKKNAFAGIFESFFPIYNEEDYKKGIKVCINADKLDKFKFYIKINKINISKMKKNFIIQEFIIGDFSGVCFTKNSVNKMLMEIVPGLNEPLVQGNVRTPFSIKISRVIKKDYTINSFYMDTAYKTIENTKIVDKKFNLIEFEENFLFSFKDTLQKLFLEVEKVFGSPQDIEFTVKGSNIYILQSRNITVNT